MSVSKTYQTKSKINAFASMLGAHFAISNICLKRLGAVHDGSPPPSYLGGPGAEKCRWEDGFIMSDLRHTERGFRWSPCTIQSFHHFLKYNNTRFNEILSFALK